MLEGKRAVIVVEKFYNEFEFWYPYFRLKEEKADIKVASPKIETFTGKYSALPVKPDVKISDLNPDNFDGIFIPGGYCPDYLRVHEPLLNFVRKMHEDGKVIAAICHGAWVLISAGIVKGKKITGAGTIKDDIVNAGAEYVDKEVVVDGNIITSRKPDDLPFMLPEIIKKLTK